MIYTDIVAFSGSTEVIHIWSWHCPIHMYMYGIVPQFGARWIYKCILILCKKNWYLPCSKYIYTVPMRNRYPSRCARKPEGSLNVPFPSRHGLSIPDVHLPEPSQEAGLDWLLVVTRTHRAGDTETNSSQPERASMEPSEWRYGEGRKMTRLAVCSIGLRHKISARSGDNFMMGTDWRVFNAGLDCAFRWRNN